MPKPNPLLVNFLAPKLFNKNGFTVPIFFQVFLIIQLFRLPAGFIPNNRSKYKAAEQRILKYLLRRYLYETEYSNLQMDKWWDNSYNLHNHQFLEAIYNQGCLKPWTFKLLYSTAIHGFSNYTFHRLCDKQGPTMTIINLNKKIVVALLEKSWDSQDAHKLGYQEDKSSKMFHVTLSGEIVPLKCIGFNNYISYGLNFKFLCVDLKTKEAISSFPVNNRQITGYVGSSSVNVDSVVVLKLSIDFERFPITLLTKIASAVAPYIQLTK